MSAVQRARTPCPSSSLVWMALQRHPRIFRLQTSSVVPPLAEILVQHATALHVLYICLSLLSLGISRHIGLTSGATRRLCPCRDAVNLPPCSLSLVDVTCFESLISFTFVTASYRGRLTRRGYALSNEAKQRCSRDPPPLPPPPGALDPMSLT